MATHEMEKNFINSIQSFCKFTNEVKTDLKKNIILDVDEEFYLQYLSKIDLIEKNKANFEILLKVESIVKKWIKLIEKELVRSQQLRRESETVGPLAELAYWRTILTRSSLINEFISTSIIQTHLEYLGCLKSKLYKAWKKLEDHVTAIEILAKDNIKYLYILEKFMVPLYRLEPPKISQYLPSLMFTLQMIYSFSRFFDNEEMITALFVKITNQLILSCKLYLTNNFDSLIWNTPKFKMINKLKDCIKLCEIYYQNYFDMKKKFKLTLEDRTIEVSEVHVFGKFNSFKTRLQKLINVLEKNAAYLILHSSVIEGIDIFAQKFTTYDTLITSQKYDTLDFRRVDFDLDYADFQKNVANAENELRTFFFTSVSNLPSVQQILLMIKRFQKLGFKQLSIDRKFLESCQKFETEIEEVRNRYNQDRSHPQIPRNVPMISGRILWIKQLMRRVEVPMEIYKSRCKVMSHEKMQKCIKMYNAIVSVFVQYEMLFHKAWSESVHIVKSALTSPLIIKNPKVNSYLVNFDPYIREVIRESEYIFKINLSVPDLVKLIIFNKDAIYYYAEKVKILINKNDQIKQSIPPLFVKLLRPILLELEMAFQPCMSTITWASLEIDEVCQTIENTLAHIQIFIKKVIDMKEARIDEIFLNISKLEIIKLSGYPCYPEEFSKTISQYVIKVSQDLSIKSATAEQAVIDIINKFMELITDPNFEESKYDWMDPSKVSKTVATDLVNEEVGQGLDVLNKPTKINLGHLHNNCMELFSYFNQKFTESLIKCTKKTLEFLKRKVGSSSILFKKNLPVDSEILLMQTDFVLEIPNILIIPTIETLQHHFNLILNNILEVHRFVNRWGQQTLNAESNKGTLLNYYEFVLNHKEIVRTSMSLKGAMLVLKDDIQQIGNIYRRFSFLWMNDKILTLKNFVELHSNLYEIKEKFTSYENLLKEIKELPEFHAIGCLRINTSKLKESLLVLAKSWKKLLGKILSDKYKENLRKISEYILNKNKVLVREIKDLDDVRVAMNCLAEIREDFISMDQEIFFIEEIYLTMAKFDVKLSKVEQDVIDSLRYNFVNMLNMSKEVQMKVFEKQEPLKNELLLGIATLKKEIATFDHDFEFDGPMVEGLPAKEASERVLLFEAWFDDLMEKHKTFCNGEAIFGMNITEYPLLNSRRKQLNLLQKLYGLYLQVTKSVDSYFKIPWKEVNTDIIISELNDFQNKCRRLPKALKEWPAYIELKTKIDDFNKCCPLLELLANNAMKDRHWERIGHLCDFKFDIENESFTVASIMKAPLLKHKDDIEDVCITAMKEKEIESKLKQIIADWSIIDLSFASFKQRGDLLLKGTETAEIVVQLEDSLMVISSLLSNRYNTHLKKDIQLWQNKLNSTSEILSKWLIVQNLWVYLEAVFIGGDISRQLPAEAKRFNGIDKTWLKLMYRAREKVNAVEVCTGDETMKRFLPFLLEQLESCQKSLSGYLETKRVIFPRFCFISDPMLLEILGQSADSHSINNYLDGFFDNICTLEFSESEYDKVIAMLSRENEKVFFEEAVVCIGGVENWLNNLLQVHRQSLNAYILQGLYIISEPETDILQLIDSSVLQVGLLAIQVIWTRQSETALVTAKKDKTIMRKTNQWFLDFLNQLIEETVKDLTKYSRQKFESLITIHLHQRDIFEDLCRFKVKNILDFEWLKQVRFYFDERMECVPIKITDITFIYQNEFLGCTDRLVITPLTDRCYITLAQALGMSFGGAPAGPAGTGKTETTKDMGKALGTYVIVFNCSDQMDFRGLGRIFKGLAQAGVWGCFDEFNRIDLPVLSVAAQQIAIILTAKKEKAHSFLFSDGEIYGIDYEFGIFITMNPGYAGRQELPENLKIMFRTVAMMVPDRQIIMRVKLAACGFKENIVLCRKFFTLYKLCEEQLSKQVHYDFGLRNILSCLRTLGAQKRAYPNDSEEMTLMRVLRDMNLSKLVDEDEPLFFSLIDDMFPGIKLTTQSYKELQRAVSKAATDLEIINHPAWNLKLVQLYESSLVRHGLMVLGPTGSGKTKCIWTLMKALTELGKPHKEVRMNPKAITASQMFGRLDATTNDWTDGIFSTLWRRSALIKKTDCLWIVLDGPVDAVWIENLNSVLDDNKTLTLANGDRMVMAPNSKLVFEPDNIDNASPATVSRMGMVFFSASVLGWRPILESWLNKKTSTLASSLSRMFDKIYQATYDFLKTKLSPKMNLLEIMYIKQCIDILEGFISNHETSDTISNTLLEKYFLFALMWSVGAVLELEDRVSLQHFFLSHSSNLNWPKLKEQEAIFEFLVSETGNWIHWNEKVAIFEYPSDEILDYHSILVPNVDNSRTMFLINLIAKQEKPVLLIGEQGTAKTVMIKSFMSTFDPEEHINKSFTFSSASTPYMIQRVFESYVEKRVGNTFGPANNKKMSIFIDDISMPMINEWGDQVTNEIVRQLMEYKGFYSLDKPGDFLILQDITLLAAMIHPGGGRNDIPPRLKRQFNIFNCTLPSDKSMDTIFRTLGKGYFCIQRFSQKIVDFIPKLISLTRIIWQATKMKMLPTPNKFHYIFNLRDLSRIWEGILRIENEQCKTIRTVLQLWKHECNRIISDRFIDHSEIKWFKVMLQNKAEKMLGQDFDHYSLSEPYFVNFLRDVPEPTGNEPDDFIFEAPKTYEEITGFEVVLNKVRFFIEQFQEEVKGIKMDLVFFHDALVHLLRVSRIIGAPRGNALLVGVGGSGKQSLTRLASFMANYNFFQIMITRSYNTQNLIEDLRKIYRMAGAGEKGITFIFTDNEIKEESFLEFINNILSVGEIANLFPKDELDEILQSIVNLMKKSDPKKAPTPDNLYEYFISRAKNKLHTVLCFSPVGDKFRSRSLKFPGIISGCIINWFFRWPKDALFAVSSHFLKDYQIIGSNYIKNQLIEIMGDVHDSVGDACVHYFNRFRRQSYVTPKSFLTFLAAYKDLYKVNLENINMLSYRMSNGLNKLVDATIQVDDLRKVLVKNQEEINEKNKQVDLILVTVNQKRYEAESIKTSVLKSKEEAEALLKIISKEKKAAEKKLKAAEPALHAAEEALLTIKATDIATVRKLAKPPYLITLIMDCVIILFNKKLDYVKVDFDKKFLQASWGEALKVMSDTKFLWNLQNFPKDNINAETVDLMLPYLNYHLYTFENAQIACGNVAGLISWTISMVAFYSINKDVLPLKSNLAIQEGKHNKAIRKLEAAELLLKEKDEDLKQVQKELDSVVAEQQIIIDQAQICQSKMDIARAMIDGLSGEKSRWTAQLSQFKSETERLVGDTIILTGFLSYAGPFNHEFRVFLQKLWFEFMKKRKIPASPSVNIIDCLSDTATVGEWSIQGLPSDELSVQNGIIVTKASRYPLLIDPQLQGRSWIVQKEKAADITITFLTDKYFRNHLEDCILNGRPLLIQDVGEELDPVLNDILEKNLIKSGFLWKVMLGDKEIDYNDEFRLYLTTKLPNPSYPPEVYARTSIIDFTVTAKGLEDQLLGRVIQTEKEELEIERTSLVADISINNRKMKQLEMDLLNKLTSVQGPLIEDLELMNVLNITKQTAADVNEKLINAKETEIKINNAREEFRPVATRGSILYFLICDMAQVNSMYQTSLLQFLERFDLSMKMSTKSPVNSKRISYIIEYLTFEVFRYKARGLYEIHKFMFVLLMTFKIDLQRDSITQDEFQYFLKGGAALDLNNVILKPPSFKWITDIVWSNLNALTSLTKFQNLTKQIISSEKSWKTWFDKDSPEEEIIPDGYHTLNTFQKLLLIRAFCMDRTLLQSKKYIASSLGQKYAEPVIAILETVYLESVEFTPIIGFLSSGSDPTLSIEQLSKKYEVLCRSISMGQGQEIFARKLMNSAIIDGFWVLLQNCHLGLEYMVEVVNFMIELENPHPNFRLWITTEPHKNFPISLLHMALKFTCEPPQGVKAGILSTYSTMNQSLLDQCDVTEYIPLIFAVSFLHTIVQERRKFGPLGWNIPYEFNTSDWLACCLFISNHLNDLDPTLGISWPTIRYMIGEVQYGGRVTDDYDKRLLNTFARTWFSDALFYDNFSFHSDYQMLIFKQTTDYVSHIEKMSTSDSPEVFGLHQNADITYQSHTTQQILDTIMSMQPKESSLGSDLKEVTVYKMASDMLEKLPAPYEEHRVYERLKIMGLTMPMNIFLKQEVNRIKAVTELARFTLKNLILAIDGVIIMSEQLKDAFDNIYDARVPELWRTKSWDSTTIGFWFTELIERNFQFYSWLFNGRPTTFWMTGFFNPQGFLTAMKQEITRSRKGWALDQVILHNDVTKYQKDEIKAAPTEGVYVYGLYLEGAGWDRRNNRLCESLNKILYVNLPVVHIYAVFNLVDKSSKLYYCPVYKKPVRTDLQFIAPLGLQTDRSPDHWILRGVALLCDIK